VHTKESLKFFLAFCVFGFLLGTAARITIQRAKILNIVWLPYILIFFLFSLFLFRLWGYRGYNFTLPGDNPARIAALSLFFCFIGLTNLSLTKN